MAAPKKFKDLSENDYDRERDHLESMSEGTTGLGMWDTPGMIQSEDIKATYGLCADCSNFFYCRQSYSNKRAYCNRMEIMLTGKDRMVECNKYEKRGQLNLNQMADIAWIIEVPNKVGFLP
ncbi:MAG: hypothetical protein ACYTE8_00940 [Planctomycetota bacterium]|jgi:hypothetical protein